MLKGQTEVVSVILIAGIAIGVISTAYFWGLPLIQKGQSNTEITQAKNLMLGLVNQINTVVTSGDQKSIAVDLNGYLEVDGENNQITYTILSKTAAVATTEWVPLNDDLKPIKEEIYSVEVGESEDVTISEQSCTIKNNCPSTETITMSGCITGEYSAGETLIVGSKTYIVDHIDCSVPPKIDGFAVIEGPEEEVVGIVGSDKGGVLIAKAIPVGDQYETIFRLRYRELDDLNTKNGYKVDIRESGNSKATKGQRTVIISKGEAETSETPSQIEGELILTPIYITLS